MGGGRGKDWGGGGRVRGVRVDLFSGLGTVTCMRPVCSRSYSSPYTLSSQILKIMIFLLVRI
jgi:hypothetical protein